MFAERTQQAPWKLPVLFSENNHYAATTPIANSTAVWNIRGGGYGVPGSVADGNDVLMCMGMLKGLLNVFAEVTTRLRMRLTG